ncbi:MAG: HNH endonuclease, partial [Nocardioides sp.]
MPTSTSATTLEAVRATVTGVRLPIWKAFRITDSTMALPVAGASFVDQKLGGVAGRVSFAQVDRLVAEALVRFDPEEAEKKRRAAAESRGVEVHLSNMDVAGTVEITGTLDYADAADLETALQAGAAALKDAGSEDTLEVRRSVALGVLARGQATLDLSGRDLTIYAHVSDDPHLGRCDNTRTPVLVAQIKTWCATATKVTIKPVIDLHDTLSVNAYEIPDRIREAVELRDHHCVFPNCTRPARRCDLD